MAVRITNLFADHGTIVQFLGEDEESGDVVIVSADHRPAQDISLALEAGEEDVYVDAEPWQVSTLVKGDA